MESNKNKNVNKLYELLIRAMNEKDKDSQEALTVAIMVVEDAERDGRIL